MKEIRQQKKQPEVIRKRILEQATILVSQKGISGVSIQNIATAVGITKGGIFHHFPNKEILIEEKFYTQLIPVKDAKGKIHRIIGISRNI